MRGLRGASLVRSLPVTFLCIRQANAKRTRRKRCCRRPSLRRVRPPATGPFIFLVMRRSQTAATVNRVKKFFCLSLLGALSVPAISGKTPHIYPPPPGRLYHGFYWGGVGTDTHDPTEHDVTSEDVARYEQAIGKEAAWIFFPTTGSSLENFRPPCADGSAILAKSRMSG